MSWQYQSMEYVSETKPKRKNRLGQYAILGIMIMGILAGFMGG
jgi:hypothetical protein